MDQVVITISVVFAMALFLIFATGLAERRELKKKISGDFEHMKFQFNYGTLTIEKGKLVPVGRPHYTCFDLRLDIYGTDLMDIYGIDDVLQHLRSGHRTRALNALLDLQREWKEKGFKIYAPSFFD